MNKRSDTWLKRLHHSLEKSANPLVSGISNLFYKKRLDSETLQQLEDLLIMADIGAPMASHVCKTLSQHSFNNDISDIAVREILATEICNILTPYALPLKISPAHKPHIILICGVNGSGKTTTTAKLAKQLQEEGNRVLLVAADTFRAAATEQLCIWGKRLQCPVIHSETHSDAAALAYQGIKEAKENNRNIVLIDTAGRLHHRKDLMAELEKIIRVIKKHDPDAPHDTLLVLDATVGQNAHMQLSAFQDSVNISGLIMTKLDGTARGGVLVSLVNKFSLPVHAIGIGESAEDLQAFQAKDFARSLCGLK